MIETWYDIQEKIDVDHQLAERIKVQEQEELSIEENATLFQQLLEKRRKHFAAKRAEKKRNKPPTKAQQRKIMCNYLKNMKGYKLKDLKLKEFDSIQEMFDRAFKRVNTFEDFRTELVKGKEKRAGTELTQEITKKQKGDLKTMFEPHVEDEIYMLVEKTYPLAPLTLSMMLEKKLIIDFESEMAYRLLKFIMKQLKKYEANPKESHLIAVKRIFRYLKGTPSLSLWYPRCLGFDLKGYSESHYARFNMDRKITSGACQLLGGKLMCWSAKKQKFVAMSSAKAEYVATARCCTNILCMKSQLTEYDIIYKKVPIFCDNTSAIKISNNLVLHSRTKHIDIIYHFIRDHILKGDIELHFIPTQYQLADIFSKPLDEPTFKRLICELGMLNIDGSKPKPSNDSLDED
ncbi:hypothetical protein Tco_0335146 [Tanacetum coccineum]